MVKKKVLITQQLPIHEHIICSSIDSAYERESYNTIRLFLLVCARACLARETRAEVIRANIRISTSPRRRQENLPHHWCTCCHNMLPVVGDTLKDHSLKLDSAQHRTLVLPVITPSDRTPSPGVPSYVGPMRCSNYIPRRYMDAETWSVPNSTTSLR